MFVRALSPWESTLKHGLLSCGLLVLFVLGPALSLSQEAGYKSLVDVEVRGANAEFATFGGSCSSHQPPPDTVIELTLLSLDRTYYRLGDDLVFDVKITNVGKEPIFLPWNPHQADFEDRALGEDYGFDEINPSLELSDNEGSGAVYGLSLLGSPDVAGSLLELRTGHWVQIREKVRLETIFVDEIRHRLASRPESELKVEPRITASAVTVTYSDGKANQNSRCLNWEIRAKGEVTIHVSPRTFDH